jgi:hypothetical protein
MKIHYARKPILYLYAYLNATSMYSILGHNHSATLVSCILNTALFISGTRHKLNAAVFAMGLW